MTGLKKEVFLKNLNESIGTGWLPPTPDLRDRTESEGDMKDLISKITGLTIEDELAKLPAKTDLRDWFKKIPIRHQGKIGSCTAHAAAAISEYYQVRLFDKHIQGSRLFIYKTTRNLMGVTGDTGSLSRYTMGALRFCGIPSERYWKYTDKRPEFDEEPSAFVYAVADNYEAVKYFCHDPMHLQLPGDKIVKSIKKYLAAGIPSMCGLYMFGSLEECDVPGGIPFPGSYENAEWGHAVALVGYDDEMKITNTQSNETTTGAFIIRNSWGPGWGEDGYGYLPYKYIEKKFAQDFWSLLSMEWVDTDVFGL